MLIFHMNMIVYIIVRMFICIYHKSKRWEQKKTDEEENNGLLIMSSEM